MYNVVRKWATFLMPIFLSFFKKIGIKKVKVRGMTKEEKNYKKMLYEDIIRQKQGKEYMQQVSIIKEEQCCKCTKKGSMRCRLNMQDNKCINFAKKKI